MSKLILLPAIVFVAFSAVGCGQFGIEEFSDASGKLMVRKPHGACDRQTVPTINLCMEAVGSDYSDVGYLDILKTSCESSGGIFSTENCKIEEGLGTCVVEAGQTNMTYVSYYAPTYDATSASEACAAGNGIYFPQ